VVIRGGFAPRSTPGSATSRRGHHEVGFLRQAPSPRGVPSHGREALTLIGERFGDAQQDGPHA
jgi:hypothetical protein